jgi:chlorobactene glucosyltransferase
MLMLILCILWSAMVATLVMRAVKQFSAYTQLTQMNPPPLHTWPRVAMIVPARNEQSNVEPCLEALLAQDYPRKQVRIIVIDDGSTDGTREQIKNYEQRDARVRLIVGRSLPQGWKGKPFACWQGVRAVESEECEWLCFMDCDTRAAPSLVRHAIEHAEQSGIDLLSLEPFQELGSFWERVLIPSGFLLLAYSQDLGRVNDPNSMDASANGQFILVRRQVYERLGGHSAVRDEICEDSALASLVKSAGCRIAVLGAELLLRTRMYHSLAEIWQGVSRNLIEMIGGVARSVVFAGLGVLLAAGAIALPLWSWLSFPISMDKSIVLTAAVCATCGSLGLFGMHIGAAIRLRIPFWYGLLFPLGYLIGAPLAAYSMLIRARHRIVWKGRIYARPGAET